MPDRTGGAQTEIGSLCYKWVSWDIDFEVEINKQGFTREHLITRYPGDQHLGREQKEGSRLSRGATGLGVVVMKPQVTPMGTVKLVSYSELSQVGVTGPGFYTPISSTQWL